MLHYRAVQEFTKPQRQLGKGYDDLQFLACCQSSDGFIMVHYSLTSWSQAGLLLLHMRTNCSVK